MGLLEENKEPSFVDKLNEKISVEPKDDKKPRGRPKGFSPKAKREAELLAQQEAQGKQIPPINDVEAEMFAKMIYGALLLPIKEEYKKNYSHITVERIKTFTAPMVQIKDYYIPNFGGIYTVMLQALISGGSIGYDYYKTSKAIVNDTTTTGSENKVNNGNTGNGQVNESKGTPEGASPTSHL